VKHTPGPWLIEYEQGDNPFITADQGGQRWNNPVVCSLYEDVTPWDSVTIGPWLEANKNAEANARLIVKAPDLYALLACVRENLLKGMSRSIQRLQAKTIEELLKEIDQ
jgi:hypothetical protein